jgi:dihydroorotase
MKTNSFDLIVQDATICNSNKTFKGDIAIYQGKIVEVGRLSHKKSDNLIKASGLHVIPGVIDTQVHFREPGFEHKENIESGSAAAVLGGVSSYFEMPNTNPPTISAERLQEKLQKASKTSWANYAFYAGATTDNIDLLASLEQISGCCGVKVFIGSSTGSLLVSDDILIKEILLKTKRRVAFHSEDEARLKQRKNLITEQSTAHMHPVWRDVETATLATKKILDMARVLDRKVHILHVTTKDEILLLSRNRNVASVEVTPQHLTLYAPQCYDLLGNYARMNPPIRDIEHLKGLWEGVDNGFVDVIGSDHAPHTRAEKECAYINSHSGMPGVQTLLPLMLNHYHQGRLSLERLVQLTSYNPANIFGIQNKGQISVGYDADIVLVDLNKKWVIDKNWLASKCGWSPFEGMEIKGYPKTTIIAGRVVANDGQLLGTPSGRALEFNLSR